MDVLGKNRNSTRVVKDGIEKEVYFCDLNPSLPKRGIQYHGSGDDDQVEPRTYHDFNGTYVQGIMGWSDQAIDDALDGEPKAYWNID